jgi:hypothetical protein
MSSIEPPKEKLGELNSGKTGCTDWIPWSMLPAKGGDWGTEWINLLNPKTLPNFLLASHRIAIRIVISVVKQQFQVAIEDTIVRERERERERERDGVTFFISFWSATLMNILHLRKYIRTRQWNVQSAAPKYWICPSMNASRISTSKDLVEVILIYKFTRSTYQRKSSKHTSLEKTGHTQENHC